MTIGYPEKIEAHRLLDDAECCNPGPWSNHSRNVAMCAERIALAVGLNSEKAYVLGLLHDIGRKFGVTHLAHVYDGYHYMMSLGYPTAAKICLTHSFNRPDLNVYIGKIDVSENQLRELEELLDAAEYDDYDRLIQLCDCLAGSEGVVDMEARMEDVKRRYGCYPREKWDSNMWLRDYFEAKAGEDIYEIVKNEAVI